MTGFHDPAYGPLPGVDARMLERHRRRFREELRRSQPVPRNRNKRMESEERRRATDDTATFAEGRDDG